MQNLTISLVQGNTHWQDIPANRDYYGKLIQTITDKTDLIILPEAFTSGFTSNAGENAETVGGESVEWLRSLSRETNAVITGSLIIRENDHYFNRLIWMRPEGTFDLYDKRHLFRMAEEHKRYAPGKNRLVAELKGWRICPLICYDLRFPVWSRNRYNQTTTDRLDYDLLLFVANWPAARRYAWQTLLRARAIENLSYCAGVNRVGTDGNNLFYSGDSTVLDFMGQPLVELGNQEQIATSTLDFQKLHTFRTAFPAWRDADNFLLCENEKNYKNNF